MQYSYNAKTLTLRYITIYQNDKILNWFLVNWHFQAIMLYSYHDQCFEATLQAKIIKRQKKYIIVISIHEVVDGNPIMYKKTTIKLIFL